MQTSLTAINRQQNPKTGRAGILHLMPFSASEVESAGLLAPSLDEVLFKGMYPPLFDRPVSPADFYPSYIETYPERDVRSMKNIGDLALFRKFVLLCAGRTGQLLNMIPKPHDIRSKDRAGWKPAIRIAGILPALKKY